MVGFYKKGLGFTGIQAFFLSANTFYSFGKVLIDRVAFKSNRKNFFTHSFHNESELRRLTDMGKGGFLFSGHVGNWENAGNLIGERITSKINVLMLDGEVEKIKQYLSTSTNEATFHLIPLKEDMSHLVLIHQALKRNELIALHADRIQVGQKTFLLPFLNGMAHFPAGPFIMAHKFKVPITFVFAVKESKRHYALSATDLMLQAESPEEIALAYVQRLEQMVRKYPNQWFNFYEYYEN